MKSKLLILLSLFAFVGGVKAQNWIWKTETAKQGEWYLYNFGNKKFVTVNDKGAPVASDIESASVFTISGLNNTDLAYNIESNQYYLYQASGNFGKYENKKEVSGGRNGTSVSSITSNYGQKWAWYIKTYSVGYQIYSNHKYSSILGSWQHRTESERYITCNGDNYSLPKNKDEYNTSNATFFFISQAQINAYNAYITAYTAASECLTHDLTTGRKNALTAAMAKNETYNDGTTNGVTKELNDLVADIIKNDYNTIGDHVDNNYEDWVGADAAKYDGVERYAGNSTNFGAGKVLYQKIVNLSDGYYELDWNAAASAAQWADGGVTAGSGIAQRYIISGADETYSDMTVWEKINIENYDDYNHKDVVHVTDGTLEYGIRNVSEGGNWYTCRINSLTYLGNTKANLKCDADKYGTFVAPFDVAIPDGINAYVVTGVENTVVQMESATLNKTLPAHTPVLVQNVGKDGTAKVDLNIYVYGDEEANHNKAAKLVGVYKDGDEIPVGAYVLQAKNEVQKFYKVNTEGFQGTANRCYLWLGENPVNAFSFNFDDVDAIEAIEALTSDKVQIFDLNGRKLDRLQKGINIVNGKKIMVK